MAQRPLTFDHLVSRKKAITKTVHIALDPELAGELEEARRERDRAAARAGARPQDTEAQAQLWEAEERAVQLERRMVEEEAVAAFTFRSIGRAAYDALVDAHPPTTEQRAKAKREGIGDILWNPETLPVALVAACLVEPKLSEDEVTAIWRDDNWNQAELQALLQAAVEVNGSRRTVELGKDFATTRPSGQKSRTA